MKSATIGLLLIVGLGLIVTSTNVRHGLPTTNGVTIVTGGSAPNLQTRLRPSQSDQNSVSTAREASPTRSIVSQNLIASRGFISNEPTVDYEGRDEEWAGTAEPQIRQSLLNIPRINPGTLSVVCGSSVCRATGSLRPSSTPSDLASAETAITNETWFSPVHDGNFIPKRSTANTGPSEAFTIDFARLHK